ncbi:sigma factor-like helix-turn-helix DNA-binding protein [Ornithinimicrobium cavernae]|uniref:sigma factor-like helix-turn-helix DNA-binding protein n=1 Tax=Ornithinimicrobium cavernae TaxID=2666047 RepID=UPI0012B16FF0|nr:sigma factor-like helix-turn-helix DNA-binding protein [Ornithinimicrobium cavernae]
MAKSSSSDTPPHVADMIERRWRGDTLSEIGAAHGLTRERIRQLLKKHGGPTGQDVRERREARDLEEQRKREAAVAAAVRDALDQRTAKTVVEVAEVTGFDSADVSKNWPQDLDYLRLHAPGNYDYQWSDEAILDAIREAALYEFPLTTKDYGELLSQGQVQGPSMPRIWQRFGSWTSACEAAGVVPGKTMRSHYESRWSDDDLLQIARQYLLDPNVPTSARYFDEWRRTVAPDGPSFQTLRNRFGSWTEVKRRALAQGGQTT